jgi:hypothetical protein
MYGWSLQVSGLLGIFIYVAKEVIEKYLWQIDLRASSVKIADN